MRALNDVEVEQVSGAQGAALTGSEVMLGVAVAAASPVIAGVAAGAAIVLAGIAIYEEL